MLTNARNVLKGTVSAVTPGAVNDEIELTLKDGLKLTAVITSKSTKNLGLKPGREACAIVKGVLVLLVRDMDGYTFSTRNQFPGVVKGVKRGVVTAQTMVELDNGDIITAVNTLDSSDDAGLAEGARVTVAIKASSVILAARA